MNKTFAHILGAATLSLISFSLSPLAAQQASQAPPAAKSYEYTVIPVSAVDGGATLNRFAEKGWEPVSPGGGEGMGAGSFPALLRSTK